MSSAWPGRRWRQPAGDGVLLFGRTAGNGPVTVALLHGGASNHRWWTPVARLLAGWHQVLWWDQRGHGRSTAGPDCTIASLAADTTALLNRLDTGPVVLAGHSAGAAVALHVAALHRLPVLGVACVDGGLDDPRERYGRTWPRAHPRMTSSHRGPTSGAVLRAWLPTAGLPPTAISAVLANYEHAGNQLRPRLAAQQERQLAYSLWRHNPAAVLPNVSCPVMAMVTDTSDDHETASRDTGLDAARHLLGDRFIEARIAGGHHLPLQQPATVAAAIARLVHLTTGRTTGKRYELTAS